MCTAFSYGDPHFTSLDGRQYTFNGHGEYILMQLGKLDFQIQSRTSRAQRSNGSLSEATIFSAFVVSANNTWIQVELDNERDGFHIYVGTDKEKENHSDYTLDYYRFGNEFGVISVPGMDVRRSGNTTIVVFSESGKNTKAF